ncbi:MAG: NCS2 family permease [Candidatus Hydrogenedentota bacterium]
MIEKLFHLKERGTNFRTESLAGLTTFLTMSYIIFVNPQILSESGMDRNAVTGATCLAAAVSSIIMGLWANIPVAQAPGMGLNAVFTFTLCIGMKLRWQEALGVVFISGVLNVILAVTRVRELVVKGIPDSQKRSITVGIGLFLSLIGFRNMGLVVDSPATLVTLGSLKNHAVLLSLAGFAVTAILLTRKVRGAFLIGIVLVTVAAFLADLSPAPAAIMAPPPDLSPTLLQLDVMTPLRNPALWGVILSFMFVDLFDSVGTLLSVCSAARLVGPDGTCPAMNRALQADAVATPFGALLGTSSTTSYIESAAGAESGGRTGLTSVVTGFLFIASLLFVPLAASVPAIATAPALVLVGFLMISEVIRIDFTDLTEGLPAFLTLTLMPLTYSISTGIGFGFVSYLLLKLGTGRMKEVHWILYPVSGLFLLVLLNS